MTFTFDTGMMIALEQRKQRATDVFRAIVRRGFLPVVPAVVYVEWWRGTSDMHDLERLQRHFPTVRVLPV